jgi:DNA-binding transcriptional regulator YiaG
MITKLDIDLLGDALERSRALRSLPPVPTRQRLRERVCVSQTAIAAALGVTPGAVSRWERGERTPRGASLQGYLKMLDRLAREAV